MTKNTTITVPESTDELVVRVHRVKRNPVAPFRCVGSGMSNQYGESLNVFRVMLGLRKEEQRLLCDLVDGYDVETGLSSLVPWDHAPSFSRAYQGLKAQSLVVRVKKGQFMLNPNLIVNPKHYLLFVKRWAEIRPSGP
jgi:hypothetical protein